MVLRMARPTRRRGSTRSQFRKRVPDDVLRKARGQRITFRLPNDNGDEVVISAKAGPEVTFSLRTSDKRSQDERHGIALAQFEQWCDAIRNGPRPLSQKRRSALAGLLYLAFAETLEDDPGDPALWAAVQEANNHAISGPLLGIYDAEADGRQEALERRFGGLVDLILQREGVVTDKASRNALLAEAGMKLTKAAEKLQRNASGDFTPDPFAASIPAWKGEVNAEPGNATTLTFENLFERWKEETRPAPSTVTSWRGHVKQFKRHLGHDDPRRVTRDNVVAWKDILLARGLKGINDGHLATIKALFNYGVRNGLLKDNSAKDVNARRRREAGDSRLPYEDDEVAQLLALADKETLPARRWLPWLMAFSGARVGEVAQLWGDRVVRVDGIPVMKIAPADDGGTLKNEGSERAVPIHPALIERGFLSFVRERGSGPLFYGGGRKKRGKSTAARHASKGVANHLAAWIRANGFTNKRKAPSHALRHWFKTECSKLGIQDSVADAIQGHVGNSGVAGRYRHIGVATMAGAIKQITVPVLPTKQKR
ncbi:MAG: site-specific integrase [Pseudolabrys sp.]|nr:site-specific integrase [Pseudolabrys sp.]